MRGIERMVDEDRYCIDILTQIAAVEDGARERSRSRSSTTTSTTASPARSRRATPAAAAEKSRELLEAVRRFSRTS